MRQHHREERLRDVEARGQSQAFVNRPHRERPQRPTDVMQQAEGDRREDEIPRLEAEAAEHWLFADSGHQCADEHGHDTLASEDFNQLAMPAAVTVAKKQTEENVQQCITRQHDADNGKAEKRGAPRWLNRRHIAQPSSQRETSRSQQRQAGEAARDASLQEKQHPYQLTERQLVNSRESEMCAMLSRIFAESEYCRQPPRKHAILAGTSMLSRWDVSAYRPRERSAKAWHTRQLTFAASDSRKHGTHFWRPTSPRSPLRRCGG